MSSSMITKTLTVVNMTCAHCESVIEHELSAVDGVKSVKASYSKGIVIVTYDETRTDLGKLEEVLALHDYFVKKEDYLTERQKVVINTKTANSEDNNPQQVMSSQKTENGYDITNIIGVLLILLAVYVVAKRFGLWNLVNLFPVAQEGMGYGMLFLIGLLTSVHCVAMCGGICLSQCVTSNKEANERTNRFSSLKPSFLYNMGRVISYTVIGGIVGALGSVISFSGAMKGIVQIIAGIFMVIMGLNMLNVFPWLRKFNPRMPKAIAKFIYAKRGVSSPFIIGLLNGLMPCGPLQSMQIYALSTGSPFRGALSMFLFSVGTVPLMFAFGALSSVLNKKYTGKMMTASAVLVLILGVFMFSSGSALSGLTLPTIPISTEQEASRNIAKIDGNVQVVTTGLASGRYEPIVVQKGIPVKWTIKAEAKDINGCNNAIIVPKYNLQVGLKEGDNLIEFTPEESGTVPFSCWMGMIRSKITIVDDLSEVDNSGTTDENTNENANDGIASQDNANNSQENTTDEGPLDDSYIIQPRIASEEMAIGKIDNGKQSVEITFDENGFNPAVIVVQRDLETEWKIQGRNVEGSVLLFPNYYSQLSMLEGENLITFYPDIDFDFFTSDQSYYGYVKVVDDINEIDEEEIRKELESYVPSEFDTGGGFPSCH